ncbi:NAD(P)H nitroreductase [Bacteroidia bacterium]|nr:NAD(P)H nitroreductase [Bacteroidia bacterium]
MTFLEMLHRRRSCRKFLDREVPQSMIEAIVDGVMTAPSSKNSCSTRLAVVRDRDTIARLSLTRTRGSAFVADAPLVVVVMGDEQASDMWLDNCAISATILQLTAESLGLGSCWVHVNARPHSDENPGGMTAEEYIHTLIPASTPFRIECMVAVGFPAEEPHLRREHDHSDKVIMVG